MLTALASRRTILREAGKKYTRTLMTIAPSEATSALHTTLGAMAICEHTESKVILLSLKYDTANHIHNIYITFFSL